MHSAVTETQYRIEHDTMGEVRVPASALYGAQTQRAVENFPISGSGLEPAQIIALARIKRAAAIVNGELGIIDAGIAQAIAAALRPVAQRAGSGTLLAALEDGAALVHVAGGEDDTKGRFLTLYLEEDPEQAVAAITRPDH